MVALLATGSVKSSTCKVSSPIYRLSVFTLFLHLYDVLVLQNSDFRLPPRPPPRETPLASHPATLSGRCYSMSLPVPAKTKDNAATATVISPGVKCNLTSYFE